MIFKRKNEKHVPDIHDHYSTVPVRTLEEEEEEEEGADQCVDHKSDGIFLFYFLQRIMGQSI